MCCDDAICSEFYISEEGDLCESRSRNTKVVKGSDNSTAKGTATDYRSRPHVTASIAS